MPTTTAAVTATAPSNANANANATSGSRRLRAFKRWMRTEGIECSDALELVESAAEQGLWVRAACDLCEGNVVAIIPKQACLTVKNCGARDLIEAASLDGYLGLSVALMYELSLGSRSPWAPYLRLLPPAEPLPLLWTPQEIDAVLQGTELYKVVKEDKCLVYEDWKECILPLLRSKPVKLDPKYFGVDQYFAAKSLIASRSFEIDDFHGFGMVPLADLFNHKTGAEDVHFTSVSSYGESDDDVNVEDSSFENSGSDESSAQNVGSKLNGSLTTLVGKSSFSEGNLESSPTQVDNPMVLEMIIVKGVKAGSEIFNTYGSLGNAAMLHRYGFTELHNPYDIVNIDLELVLQWSSSLFSDRFCRARLSIWRRLDYSGCVSQNSEYFEIASDGEPQIELLVLLYIMLIPEEAFYKLDLAVSTMGNFKKSPGNICSNKISLVLGRTSAMSQDLLLTRGVRDALLSLADIRESLYGSGTVEDDMKALRDCCIRERNLFNSLTLRVSERRIIEKLRNYATGSARSSNTTKRVGERKKLKRT